MKKCILLRVGLTLCALSSWSWGALIFEDTFEGATSTATTGTGGAISGDVNWNLSRFTNAALNADNPEVYGIIGTDKTDYGTMQAVLPPNEIGQNPSWMGTQMSHRTTGVLAGYSIDQLTLSLEQKSMTTGTQIGYSNIEFRQRIWDPSLNGGTGGYQGSVNLLQARFTNAAEDAWENFSQDFSDMNILSAGFTTFDAHPQSTVDIYMQVTAGSWVRGDTVDMSWDNIQINSVPEPSVLSLVLLGLAGVLVWRRKS